MMIYILKWNHQLTRKSWLPNQWFLDETLPYVARLLVLCSLRTCRKGNNTWEMLTVWEPARSDYKRVCLLLFSQGHRDWLGIAWSNEAWWVMIQNHWPSQKSWMSKKTIKVTSQRTALCLIIGKPPKMLLKENNHDFWGCSRSRSRTEHIPVAPGVRPRPQPAPWCREMDLCLTHDKAYISNSQQFNHTFDQAISHIFTHCSWSMW